MKYSLHNRVSVSYLKKADEIFIPYKDRRAIPDYAEKYPQTALVLEVPPLTQWEMAELKEYSILAQGRLTLCLPEMNDPRVTELVSENIPFFWGYTITTFAELKALIDLGVSQVRIGAPLFFECEKLKSFNITKRIVANIAHDGYIPGMDGINGSWIRPEDVEIYNNDFDIIEFADCDASKEEALYRIYAEQKNWPGRVDMIISNIHTDAYNRMILPEFAASRRTCGQRCAAGGACRICYRILLLADPELIKEYSEAIEHN